jgi:hypothetical protein
MKPWQLVHFFALALAFWVLVPFAPHLKLR